MNQWSRRRKRIILTIILTLLVVLIGAPLFFLFYRVPSCNDLKQNGNETGIDCGGSCRLICPASSLPLVVRGDPQVLTVQENTFEAVVLVENPNVNGEIYRAQYTLRIYDNKSIIPVKVIEGTTYIPRGTMFAIFEGPFILEGSIVPDRITLEWHKESLIWQENNVPATELLVKEIKLSREDTTPRLDAIIENLSKQEVTNIDLVALISNESGNIFAASKTFIDKLSAGGQAPIIFTWPVALKDSALNIRVITRLLPDQSFIR